MLLWRAGIVDYPPAWRLIFRSRHFVPLFEGKNGGNPGRP